VASAEGCSAAWLDKEVAYWKIGLGVWAEAIVEQGKAKPEEFRRMIRFSAHIAPDGTVTEVTPLDQPPLPTDMQKAMQLLKTMTLVHPPGIACSAVVDWNASCARLHTQG
jgi:hypothetical protein